MALKTCPMCAEKIQSAAKVCKHCGHKFTAAELKSEDTASALGGCLVILVLGALVYSCSGMGESSEEKAAREKKETAQTAEDRRKGFHCLSGWDGSHSDMVTQVKRILRDPSSFEHAETRITPANAQGKHQIAMTYRARNGFGGMNVDVARGEVDQTNCSVSIESFGEDL